MIKYKFFTILSFFVISSCSNLLTWHLDMGIHKNKDQKAEVVSESIEKKQIQQISINAEIVWDTSVNSGIKGNTGYLYPEIVNDIMYTVDSDGLLSALSLTDGSILWNVETDTKVTSGLSIVNNKTCIGTTTAKILCYKIDSLSSNNHIPLISAMSNMVSLTDFTADIDIDLVTESSSPIQGINDLLLIKLDNDDLYLMDPVIKNTIWKSTSQIISLRSKGSSRPLIQDGNIYVARDNGSVSSYQIADGVLNWFTIISSRSGRNDLESQRDAEMSIKIENSRLYYGHMQGELSALDLSSGQIIWSSPFSFISDISITGSSLYGSTTDNIIVSVDKASGFLNWKSKKSDEQLTQPFVINDIVMAFTTEGTLVAFTKDGNYVYEEKFDLNLHPQTKFIIKKNKLYFQTLDGDIVHILITI